MITDAAAWEMAEQNKGLVITTLERKFPWILDRARTGAMDSGDYIAAGMHGLFLAARRFKPEMGREFSTYAMHWIYRDISRAFRMQGFRAVKVPCSAYDELSKLHRKHKTDFPRWLREEGPSRLKQAQAALGDCIYLDAEFTTTEGQGHTYDEAILTVPDGKAKASMQQDDRMRILLLALRRLPPREREAIMYLFNFKIEGPQLTRRAVARRMQVKRKTLRTMRWSALKKLRAIFKEAGITQEAMLGDIP